MPKRYSEQERAYIQKRLKEEAAKCMAQYGLRRTTVDEIVKRVKIPKGTFYLFYQSKELLLFEVILEQHEAIDRRIEAEMNALDPAHVTVKELTDILFGFYKLASELPILKTIDADAVMLLAQRLPQGMLEEHFAHDDTMFERIFLKLPLKQGVDPKAFTAALQSIYFSTLHKDEIGEQGFDEGLRLLIHGLAMQLITE